MHDELLDPTAYVTLAEAAPLLNKHRDTIKGYRRDGRWPNAKQDATGLGTWRIPVSDLVASGDLDPAQVGSVPQALGLLRESKAESALRAQLAEVAAERTVWRELAEERGRAADNLTKMLTLALSADRAQ